MTEPQDADFIFRKSVLDYLKRWEKQKGTSVFGLETNPAINGATAAATFWYADDELMAVLDVSWRGFEREAMNRVIALADFYEDSLTPDAAKGFTAALIAVPGDFRFEIEDPVVEGYELWFVFGTINFSAFGVYHKKTEG